MIVRIVFFMFCIMFIFLKIFFILIHPHFHLAFLREVLPKFPSPFKERGRGEVYSYLFILFLKDQKELVLLDKGCVGIGMLDEIPLVKQGVVTVNGPAKILCYTDGLVELMDGRDVSAETADIEVAIMNNDPIDINIQEIIRKQKILEDSTAIFDDISILGVEIF